MLYKRIFYCFDVIVTKENNSYFDGYMTLTDIDLQSFVFKVVHARCESAVKGIFSDKSGTDFYSHQLVISRKLAKVIIRQKEGNILDVAFLLECARLDQNIRNVTGTLNGIPVIFSEICCRRNDSCVVEGDIFIKSNFLTAVSNQTVTYPSFQSTIYNSIIADAVVENDRLKS